MSSNLVNLNPLCKLEVKFDSLESLITTKKYVIEVTHTICNNDKSFFGDLYEITNEHHGIPGLMKVIHGETASDLSIVQPMGDTLKPKLMDYTYMNNTYKY